MAGNMIKITDYDKVTPTKDDVLLINQNGSNRKTTVNDLVGDISTLGGKKLIEKVNENTTSLNEMVKCEKKNLVLLNGWVALDKIPNIVIIGDVVNVNMRIKEGVFTEGTKICETNSPIYGGNTMFPIYNGAGILNGCVYINSNGDVVCGSNITNNIDIIINISYNIE